ncbi:dCTP pyrophosphatase 1 [Desmophyllum pertusum]|uniref:dCTP pyrophosphatase 1 n=1 Tax=Desmophyllum pertusum TaxID=174260 RepID=A0A9W9ZWA9_9CNID|nr:dCTP pyrophosphatase 1 [Desmophyllum pertusum]
MFESCWSNGSLDHDRKAWMFKKRTLFSSAKSPPWRKYAVSVCKGKRLGSIHQPRNLVLAMVGEVGEVAELFQWKGEVKEGLPDWSPKEKHHLAQELSDVLVYLVRLAEKCHVDLPQEVVAKIAVNSKKYPAHLVKGSSKKYTEYKDMKLQITDRCTYIF